MLFFLIYIITLSLCNLIFQQEGRINNSFQIELNITEVENKQLDMNNLWFNFYFDFPTPITIQIENSTNDYKQLLQVDLDEPQYGLFISSQYQLPKQRTHIILNPLPQYQDQSYKYQIQLNKSPRVLTRFQPEIGFTQNSTEVLYILNMTYETSGFYQIDINYEYGSGILELQSCSNNICQKQHNESILLLNFSQINCILIQQNTFQDLCSHQLKLITYNPTYYHLNLKHYSSANVQFVKPNKITQIEILNKEASLVLDDLSTLNFIYFNQQIKAIQFSRNSRKHFVNNVITLLNEEQNLQDWDQNFYIQSFSNQKLTLQYINSIQILYFNSNYRLEQEEDSYKFFCVETIFPEFLFEIFVYDQQLLVQIYFSNQTQFPNENQNQFELIESNTKIIQMKGSNKFYIGIKTKQLALEYQLYIRETTHYYLNLFEQRKISYCKTCQIEFKYLSQNQGEIQLHIHYNSMKYEEDNSLFEIKFVENGKFIHQLQTYHQKKYIRYSLFVNQQLQYIIITRSQIQQDIELIITDQKVLEIDFDQDISSIDFSVEIFKIKNKNNNQYYIYFKEDLQDTIEIINKNGQSEFQKIAQNYYQVKFTNNQNKEAFTYFMIAGINSQITFQISDQGCTKITIISQNIFLSSLTYVYELKSLILSTIILDCNNISCEEFQANKILVTTKLGYKNESIDYKKGYYNIQEYRQSLNELYEPLYDIESIQLIATINYFDKVYNFSSNVYPIQPQIQEFLQQKQQSQTDFLFLVILLIVLIICNWLVFVKVIFRKKVSILPKIIEKRTKSYEDEEESLQIDDL